MTETLSVTYFLLERPRRLERRLVVLVGPGEQHLAELVARAGLVVASLSLRPSSQPSRPGQPVHVSVSISTQMGASSKYSNIPVDQRLLDRQRPGRQQLGRQQPEPQQQPAGLQRPVALRQPVVLEKSESVNGS